MKGIRSIVVLLMQLCVSVTAVARSPINVHAACLNKIVSVRGGAGPLNAKDTAKVAAYVLGAQGAYGVLAPAQANEAFGLPSNPFDDFFMKRGGLLVISIYLLVQELVFKGVTLNKAVGISAIPVAIGLLQSTLNGDIAKLGLKPGMEYFTLAFWSLLAYTGLTGSKYADAFVKASAVLGGIGGLVFYFFPKETLQSLGTQAQAQASSTASQIQIRAFAVFHLTSSIIISSLLWGKNVDALKAIGYGWIPMALYIIDGLFGNKDFVNLRLNQGVLISWLIFHSIVVATLAF